MAGISDGFRITCDVSDVRLGSAACIIGRSKALKSCAARLLKA